MDNIKEYEKLIYHCNTLRTTVSDRMVEKMEEFDPQLRILNTKIEYCRMAIITFD